MTTRSEQTKVTPIKRLSITDMPRDVQGCTGTLRKSICDSVNYCKRYPLKLAILKAILKYSYNYLVQYEQAVEVSKPVKKTEKPTTK